MVNPLVRSSLPGFLRYAVYAGFAGLVLLGPGLQTPRADMLKTIQRPGVSVRYQDNLKTAAVQVADLYVKVKKELEAELGWTYEPAPEIVLIRDNDYFLKMARNPYVAAFAVPDRRLVVIDYSRMVQNPFSIDITLKHEVCHLILHHHIRSDRLPKWLDEGVAEWISDGPGEILRDPKIFYLDDALLSGHFIPLKDLKHKFPENRKLLILAYEESKSVVQYIAKRYGRKGVLGILNHLKNGYEIRLAVEKSLDVTLDELEMKWRESLKKQSTWMTYIALYIYEIIFLAAAFLTVVGFIRFLIKKRAYKDDEDDEEMMG